MKNILYLWSEKMKKHSTNNIIHLNFIIMKKGLFFILMILGLSTYAQVAQSTQIEYNKVKVPGVSITIAGYEVDFIQNVLQYRLETIGGLKGSNKQGFRFYPAQILHELGFIKYDIYTSIDKGDKKNNFITINMMVSKGFDNFVNPVDDAELTEKMKDFLTYFVGEYLPEHIKKQKIDTLTKTIAALEKECGSLSTDIDKLKKEITSLTNKLNGKEAEFAKKNVELENAKDELNRIK